MLKFALKLSIEQKEKFGCIGIIVDAKIDSISYYEQFGFSQLEILKGSMDIRPYPKTLFLATQTIEKSIISQ